jgi:hypothetical protein
VDPASSLLAFLPEAGGDHPTSDRLAAQADAVQLAQLLGGQRRTTVRVALADDRQRRGADIIGLAPVARPAALLGDQTLDAAGPQRLQQPQRLPSTDAQQLGGGRRRQSLTIQIAQHLQPRQFLVAHAPNRHPKPSRQHAGRVTCLTGTGVTFSSGRYSAISPK